jgi:hypothetical protein
MPAAQALILRNYVVEILTPTPRRWTPVRGGGITVLGNFYSTHRVDVPEFTEDDAPAPASLTIAIGNAQNEAQDLWGNPANRRAVITIYDVRFDATGAVTSQTVWFIGKTGAPSFDGELVQLECHADQGRRGSSPTKDSATLMSSHTPPADGGKTPWFTGSEVPFWTG